MKNAADVAQKWNKNLTGSIDSIKAGVNGVTENPMEKAAANVDGMRAGINRALDSGKWQRSLRAKTTDDWRQAMLKKGVNRIADGARQAQPAMQKFMEQWLPYEQQLTDQLKSMPRGTPEQNRQRMLAAFDWNSKFVRQP